MADWKTEINGDLVISQGGIDITDDEAETAKQNILFRLQTGLFDYDPEPDLGAGLDEFVGRPNTRDTGLAVKRAVSLALMRDGSFPPNTTTVEVVPLSYDILAIYVFHQPKFTGTGGPVTVSVSFNLMVGTVTQLDGEIR